MGLDYKEAYEGALPSNIGVNKTLEILMEHFYWSRWIRMFIR